MTEKGEAAEPDSEPLPEPVPEPASESISKQISKSDLESVMQETAQELPISAEIERELEAEEQKLETIAPWGEERESSDKGGIESGMQQATLRSQMQSQQDPEEQRTQPQGPEDTARLAELDREENEELADNNIWKKMSDQYTKVLAFDYDNGCEILSIKPQDIGLLPREIWTYGNNSFLLHGYYNYRHLILAKLLDPQQPPRYLLRAIISAMKSIWLPCSVFRILCWPGSSPRAMEDLGTGIRISGCNDCLFHNRRFSAILVAENIWVHECGTRKGMDCGRRKGNKRESDNRSIRNKTGIIRIAGGHSLYEGSHPPGKKGSSPG